MLLLNCKISIVTVCYNSAKTIEKTIQSVTNQTYPNIEYIIIDGYSTDGTREIIHKYTNHISYFISEPDNGIYEAMNKAIDVASGNYIFFLGSDDYLASNNIIDKVAEVLSSSSDIDILCGKVMVIDDRLGLCRMRGEPLTKEQIINGNMPPHQGIFAKVDLLKKQHFSLKYRIAADFDFFLKNYLDNKNVAWFEECIAHYSCNGLSGTSDIWIKEYADILNKYTPYKKNMLSERGKIILASLADKIGVIRWVKIFWGGWEEIKNHN